MYIGIEVSIAGTWVAENIHYIIYDGHGGTKPGRRTTTTFLCIHHHLRKVLQALQHVFDRVTTYGSRPQAIVTVFEPTSNVIDDDHFTTVPLAENILEPFLQELRSWENFDLEGVADLKLSRKIVAYVKSDRYANPRLTLKRLIHQKDEGNDFYKSFELTGASSCYRLVLEDMDRLLSHHTIENLIDTIGIDFVRELIHLFFVLNLNQVATTIAMLEAFNAFEYKRQPDMRQFISRTATMQLEGLTQVIEDKFGIPYKISDQQQAKIYYRRATLCNFNYTGEQEEIRRAFAFVCRAQALAPNDQAIQSLAYGIRPKLGI